ncbi:hypothetical protein [Corynebacterium glaucum]|uniref:hypothetical protein n=1 Tax=Corynebacterium glaucum TaxID=187491 RepID=UPI0025B54D2C|nr:hypothetical protein [Corynebacterium glaucum]WJZ06624.1 hypothetical protein CGLAUT_00510 [Corynebacterium glaucum]
MDKLFDGMHVVPGDLLIRASGAVPGAVPGAAPGDGFSGLVEVAGGYSIPHRFATERAIARAAARHHPRGIAYEIPAAYRAAAYGLTHPDFTVTGFGALALYGLPFLVDACDTVLEGPRVDRKQLATATTPTLVRGHLKRDEVWNVHCHGRPITVAAPAIAVVQALKAIRQGEASWSTIPVEGRDPAFVRAVQLVDAARRFLDVETEEIVRASRQKLNSRWVSEVVAASSKNADSPKETEMRLLAQQLADRYCLTLKEQVVIRKDGEPITRLDLAFMEPKVGLMYDGAQHWDFERRQKDAKINLDAATLRWTMLRFASGTLGTLPTTVAGLLDEIL